MGAFGRLAMAFAVAAMLAACGTSQGACKVDYDCDGTLVCKKSTGKCVEVVCRADPDCLDPTLACVDNECVKKGAATSGETATTSEP